MKIFHCEVKRNKVITPQLCAICPRIAGCRAFRLYYRQSSDEYISFVARICERFPDKYQMEVLFMAEKQTFVQIVDRGTGKVERVTDLKELEALSVEDKLELARTKILYVVSHKLEPVIRVEMKKVSLAPAPQQAAPKPAPKPAVQPKPAPKPEKKEKQAEIPLKPSTKGRPKRK